MLTFAVGNHTLHLQQSTKPVVVQEGVDNHDFDGLISISYSYLTRAFLRL